MLLWYKYCLLKVNPADYVSSRLKDQLW